jgi:cellobiose-specific phosphotransferase system component IIB
MEVTGKSTGLVFTSVKAEARELQQEARINKMAKDKL